MFIAQLALPNLGELDISSLRTGIMAGSLCPPEVMQRVHRELGMAQASNSLTPALSRASCACQPAHLPALHPYVVEY